MEKDYLGHGVMGNMLGYPREIHHWICSDGRIFFDYEQAKEHEDFLTKQAMDPTTYSAANSVSSDERIPLDIRF